MPAATATPTRGAPSRRPTPVASARVQTARRIDAFLRQRGSPLAGYGPSFVRAAERRGVDPFFLVAITGAETEFGRTGNAARIRNPFGMGPGLRYSSWGAAIDAAAANLATNPAYQGKTTIAAIGSSWAPAGAANDPTGLNNNWARNVTASYTAVSGRAVSPDARVLGTSGPAPSAGGEVRQRKLEPRGGPGQGTHSYTERGSRWTDDTAYDLFGPSGTRILSPVEGTVTRISGRPGGDPRFAGYGITVQTKNGALFFKHLGTKDVRVGQKIGPGDSIGTLDPKTAGGSHLHLGAENKGVLERVKSLYAEGKISGRGIDPYIDPITGQPRAGFFDPGGSGEALQGTDNDLAGLISSAAAALKALGGFLSDPVGIVMRIALLLLGLILFALAISRATGVSPRAIAATAVTRGRA